MRKTTLLVTLGYLIAAAAVAPPLASQATPRINFEKYTLPNGLQVILHEDHSTPIVAVNTWYHVGSADELPGRTGFAHLFEHIMFMGSQNVPVGMFDQWLEAAGANNNGSTSQDRTTYYEVLPSNALELSLWLNADRMGWLLPTLDLPKVDLQREVVKNERRQSYDNVPYGRANETILAALYPKSHPYSWPVIGSMADLSAATLDDTKNFFRIYYAPNNATITIAGDFDPAKAKQLVARYFGSITRGPPVTRRTTVPAVTIARDTFLVLEDKVQLPRLFYNWPTVKLFAPDDAALDILARVLANDRNSRLYKKLVYDLQVVQSVRAGQESGRLAGKFQIDVLLKPGQTTTDINKLVEAEITGIINNGITLRELVRAQNYFRSEFLDEMASVLGKADRLNSYNYFAGNPDFAQQDAARYDKVTAADVQRVARTYLGKPKIVLTVVPEGKKELMLTTSGGGR